MGRNTTSFVFILLFLATACKKSTTENPTPRKEFMYVQDERNLSYGDTSPLLIDMNKDGQGDFVLFIELVADAQGDHMYFGINPLGENKVLSGPPDNSKYLNMGFAVAKNIPEPLGTNPQGGHIWTTDHSILGLRHNKADNTIYNEGEWYGEVPRYAGIIVRKYNRTYLGWMRIKVNLLTMRITSIDYALEKSGQSQILTGEH